MKRLTLMAVLVFASLAAIAEEQAGIVIPATGEIAPAPEGKPLAAGRVYTATEYRELQEKADRQKAEFDALLVVCQQQRAERELIVSAILQAVTAGDYKRVAEIVRQITVASLVSVGNGGGQK